MPKMPTAPPDFVQQEQDQARREYLEARWTDMLNTIMDDTDDGEAGARILQRMAEEGYLRESFAFVDALFNLAMGAVVLEGLLKVAMGEAFGDNCGRCAVCRARAAGLN